MKKIIAVVILLCMSSFAQNAGNTGLSFLKFGFGARNSGLGDAGSVMANDVTSLFYNPAGLRGLNKTEIMVMHSEWIEDTRSEMLGAVTEIFGLPFALGLNLTTVDDIPIRTAPTTNPDALFNANYFSASLSTGFKLIENLNAGITLRYIYEGLYNEEADGIGFDFGLKYKTAVEGLELSGVVRNIGTMSQLLVEKTKLPGEFRAGATYNFSLSDMKINVLAGAEYQNYFIAGDDHINMGLELNYNNLVSIRGGYQTGYESKGFTGGFGLEYGNFEFDYAFVPFEYGLGNASLLSLSFKF